MTHFEDGPPAKRHCGSKRHSQAVADAASGHETAVTSSTSSYSSSITRVELPAEVFSVIWSFLIEPEEEPEADSCVDLKTVFCFMLVSKNVQEGFHECKGWSKCAESLKREANAKKQIIDAYQNRCMEESNLTDLDAVQALLTQATYMTSLDARIVRIHQEFFLEACILSGIHYGLLEVPSRHDFGYNSFLYGVVSPLSVGFELRTALRTGAFL